MFQKVIGNMFLTPLILCFQTRVLVTHGLAYLPQCDVIVTMENGIIREIGAYAELIDNNGAFAEFVRTYASMEDSGDEGEASMYLIITKYTFICKENKLRYLSRKIIL